MKDARSYIEEYDPAMERLEALVERVQKDAFEAGAKSTADQMFEIVGESKSHVDEIVDAALRH